MIPEETKLREQLARLSPDVRKKWVKVDKLPYIHASDEEKPNPYASPVVGRFDYMETADYILACNPAAIEALLGEIDELRKALDHLT